MKRLLLFVFLFIIGCASGNEKYSPLPNSVDTTQEQTIISDAINSSAKEMDKTGTVSNKKIDELIIASRFCRSKLESVTNSLNACYDNYSKDKTKLDVCSNSLYELKKEHRWDWFGNLGDTIKGFMYGALFATIAMIALAFIARAKKFLTF